jgi:hypothetical protein
MKRRRATKAMKADDLIVGPPELGRPRLGQIHHLLADDGKKKRKRKAPRKKKVMRYLKKLRQQRHDLDTMRPGKIESLLAKVWPDKHNLPSRHTIARALGRRKD